MKGPRRHAPRVISVGGGKGGVGKSITACNLAVAMAQQDLRVVLVDADLGGANQHTLFGIDRAESGITALLEHRVEELEQTAIVTSVPNLRLVVGAGAIPNAANINHGQKLRLLRHIRGMDADVVIVDVGAGTSHNTVDFFDSADVHIVVVTPQLTSIQNAYGFLKAAVLRHFRQLAEESSQLAQLDAAMTSRTTERVDELLARLEADQPAFAEAMRAGLLRFDARMIGNQVADAQELGIFQGVSRMVRDFLRLPLPLAGWIRTGRPIHDSINRRVPLMLSAPRDENALAFRRMAEALMWPPEAGGTPVAPRAPAQHSAGPAEPSSSLRQAPRTAVSWPATLARTDGNTAVRVLDVSAGGVGVETSEPLREGELGRLRVVAPDEAAIELPVVVRSFDGSSRRAGLAFAVDERDGPLARRLLARAQAGARTRNAS